MCDRSAVLIIFLILKIIILIIVPIILFILYRSENGTYTLVGVLDAVFIIIFIILKLTVNSCITNSKFSYIKSTNESKTAIKENKDIMYEDINATSQYSIDNDKMAYFYGLNYAPLNRYRIMCDEKSYMNLNLDKASK